MNPIVIPKPDYREVAGREEGIAKSWLYEQEHDSKAYIADKGASNSKVQKGRRNLYA